MSSYFLESLLKVSEKAANIARICRQNQHLFKLLVQEKKPEEKNPRFVQDFKTLADVLIQETVKHDIGTQFSDIEGHIHGEESNSFCNLLGDSITVKVEKDERATAALLSKVLDGDMEAADLLATEVHRELSIDEINYGSVPLPKDLEFPLHQMGMWIDPIDSTAEYISGVEYKSSVGDMYHSGLRCVTVLIGVFDRLTGIPVAGVINQPFYSQDGLLWHGRCLWGISVQDCNYCSVTGIKPCEKKIVTLSGNERASLKEKLSSCGYTVTEAAGAGYKLLCVADGEADAYVLSKGSTFFWDTCGPHAVLRSLGGFIVSYSKASESANSDNSPVEEITYYVPEETDKSKGIKGFCNSGGLIACRDKQTLSEMISIVKK